MRQNNVEISLNKEREVPLLDGAPRLIEAVEGVRLVVKRRAGGIYVLSLIFGNGARGNRIEQAAGKPDYLALYVCDREHNAVPEAIMHRAGAAPGLFRTHSD